MNHEGTPLARTKSGTLDLTTDTRGLLVNARLDPKSPAVQVIRSAMERRDMDEMSFAFRTVRQDFNEDTAVRRLLEVNIHKGDVSVVNYGASDATSAHIRGTAAALTYLRDLDPETAMAEIRGLDDPAAAVLQSAHRNIGDMLRSVAPRPRLSVADAETFLTEPR